MHAVKNSSCGKRFNDHGAGNTCSAGCAHAWYKFYAYVRPDRLAAGWDRDRIVAEALPVGFAGTVVDRAVLLHVETPAQRIDRHADIVHVAAPHALHEARVLGLAVAFRQRRTGVHI